MPLPTTVGVNEFIVKLKAAKPKMGVAVGRGLKRAGTHLQGVSQKIVPVEQGPLKGSAFTRNVGGTGWDTDIVVGYTASYAVFVHEDLEAAHGATFNQKHAKEIANATTKAQKKVFFNRGPNQRAKFLEEPARTTVPEMMKLIELETRQVKK